MAEIKISLLPEATEADGAVVIPVVQGGITKKITLDRLLFDDCIGSDEINTGAVGAAELSDTFEAQLLEDFRLDITPASGFANQDDITTLTTSVNTKTQVHHGSEAPSANAIRVGDLFINTSNDTLLRSTDGSSFDQIITVVPDLAITNDKIANSTIEYSKFTTAAIEKLLEATAVKVEVDEALNALTVNSRDINQLQVDVGTFINEFTINADQISDGISVYSGEIGNLTITADNISTDLQYAGTGDFATAVNTGVANYTGNINNLTITAGNFENSFSFEGIGDFASVTNTLISNYTGDIGNLNITTGNFANDFAFSSVGDFATAVNTGIANYTGDITNLNITTGNFDTNFAISSVGDFTTGVNTGIQNYSGSIANLTIDVENLVQDFDFSSVGNFTTAVNSGIQNYSGSMNNLTIDVGNLSQNFDWTSTSITGSNAWQTGVQTVINQSYIETLGFVTGDISATINWSQYLNDNGSGDTSLSSNIATLVNTGIDASFNSITQLSGSAANGFTFSLDAADITATINVGEVDDWLNSAMTAAFTNTAVNVGINNIDLGSGSAQSLFDNFFSHAKVTGAIKTSIGAITGDVLVTDNEGNVTFDVATLVGDITGDNLTVNVANLVYTPSGGGANASFITSSGFIDDNILGNINASKLSGTIDFTPGTGNVDYTGLIINVNENIQDWTQTVSGIQNTMVIDGTGSAGTGTGTGGTIADGTITSSMVSQTGFRIDASKVDNLTLTVEDGIVNSAPSVFTFETDAEGNKSISGIKGASIDQTGFEITIDAMSGNLASAVNQIQNNISLDASNLTGEIDFGNLTQTGLTINANAVANTANAGSIYDSTTDANDSTGSSSRWAQESAFRKNIAASTLVSVRYEDMSLGLTANGLGYIPGVSGGGFTGSSVASSDLQNFVAIIEGEGVNAVQFMLADSTYRESVNGRVEFIYYIPAEYADDFGEDASNSVYWSIGAGTDHRYEAEAQKVVFGTWTKATLSFGAINGGVDKVSVQRFIRLIKAESTASTLANPHTYEVVRFFGTHGNLQPVFSGALDGDYKIIISSVKVFGGTLEAAMTQIQSTIDNLDLSATINANNISGGTLDLAGAGVNLTGVNFSSGGNFGIASGGGLSPTQLKNEDWNSLTDTGTGTFATAVNSLVAGATINASNISGGELNIGTNGITISGINQSHLSDVNFENLPEGSTILSTFNSQVQSVSAGLNIDVSKVKIGEGTAGEVDFAAVDANGDVTFNFGDTSIVGMDIDFGTGAGLSSSSYSTFTQSIGSITVDLGSSLGTDSNGNIDFSNSNLSFTGISIGPSQVTGNGALGSGITLPTDQLTGSVTNDQLPTISQQKLPSIPGNKLAGTASTDFKIDPGDNINNGALGTGVTVAPDNLPGTDNAAMFDYIGSILNNSSAFNLIGSTLSVDVGNLTINTGDLADAIDVTETDDQGNETTVKKLPSSKLDVSGIRIDDLDLVNSTFNLTATVSGSGNNAAVVLNVDGTGDNIFDVDTNGNVIINQTIVEKTIIESQIIQTTIQQYSTLPFVGDAEVVTYMSGGIARTGTFYIG